MPPDRGVDDASPLASSWYVCRPGGAPQGPLSIEGVLEAIMRGIVRDDAQVCEAVGMSRTWRAITAVGRFRASLEGQDKSVKRAGPPPPVVLTETAVAPGQAAPVPPPPATERSPRTMAMAATPPAAPRPAVALPRPVKPSGLGSTMALDPPAPAPMAAAPPAAPAWSPAPAPPPAAAAAPISTPPPAPMPPAALAAAAARKNVTVPMVGSAPLPVARKNVTVPMVGPAAPHAALLAQAAPPPPPVAAPPPPPQAAPPPVAASAPMTTVLVPTVAVAPEPIAAPLTADPFALGPAFPPPSSPPPSEVPMPPLRPRRTGLWIAVAAIVVVGGGFGAAVRFTPLGARLAALRSTPAAASAATPNPDGSSAPADAPGGSAADPDAEASASSAASAAPDSADPAPTGAPACDKSRTPKPVCEWAVALADGRDAPRPGFEPVQAFLLAEGFDRAMGRVLSEATDAGQNAEGQPLYRYRVTSNGVYGYCLQSNQKIAMDTVYTLWVKKHDKATPTPSPSGKPEECVVIDHEELPGTLTELLQMPAGDPALKETALRAVSQIAAYDRAK